MYCRDGLVSFLLGVWRAGGAQEPAELLRVHKDMVSEALPKDSVCCVRAMMRCKMYAEQGERVGWKERGEEECIGRPGGASFKFGKE